MYLHESLCVCMSLCVHVSVCDVKVVSAVTPQAAKAHSAPFTLSAQEGVPLQRESFAIGHVY